MKSVTGSCAAFYLLVYLSFVIYCCKCMLPLEIVLAVTNFSAVLWFSILLSVYETCKLGTHSPHTLGNEMEIDSGKSSSSGFVLLDCPQSMKIDSSSASILGSISDYFLSLSNGWDLTSFLKSLSKILKTLNLSSCMTTNVKEGISSPYTVRSKILYLYCLLWKNSIW